MSSQIQYKNSEDRSVRLTIYSKNSFCTHGLRYILIKNFSNITVDHAKDKQDITKNKYDFIFYIQEPNGNGKKTISEIKKINSEIIHHAKVVIFSFYDDLHILNNINNIHSAGFINLNIDVDNIISDIKQIMLDGKMVVSTLNKDINKFLLRITPRQIEILNLISKGLTNKEIAKRLGISPFTVRMHISSLIKILNVPNRYAAVSLAKEYNLI